MVSPRWIKQLSLRPLPYQVAEPGVVLDDVEVLEGGVEPEDAARVDGAKREQVVQQDEPETGSQRDAQRPLSSRQALAESPSS